MNHLTDNLIVRTPLLPFNSCNNEAKGLIYLKPENLQRFGSYKIRGISAVFQNIAPKRLEKGIAAASAGNMGQAIAFMAQRNQIKCNIYVPDTTPNIKKSRIKDLGANLIELPFHEIWRMIECPPMAESFFFVHPVYTDALLAGYQKIAEEIITDLPDVEAIVIPIGVGGLAIAISQMMTKLMPHVAIFTCEVETAAPFKAALNNGKSVKLKPSPSFVDAIGTPQVLPYVFDILAPLIKDSEVVKLIDIQNAVKVLLQNNKLLCEGAAACSLAAAITIQRRASYKNIVAILTGGNLGTHYIDFNFA